jgi:hypothetical protein
LSALHRQSAIFIETLVGNIRSTHRGFGRPNLIDSGGGEGNQFIPPGQSYSHDPTMMDANGDTAIVYYGDYDSKEGVTNADKAEMSSYSEAATAASRGVSVPQYRSDREASTAASRDVSVQQLRINREESTAASRNVSVPQYRIDSEAATAASRDVSVPQYRSDREASAATSKGVSVQQLRIDKEAGTAERRGVSVQQLRIDQKAATAAKKIKADAMGMTLSEFNKLPHVKLENQALRKKRALEAKDIKNKKTKV